MHATQAAPVVEEVLRFENLPVGSSATRRAIVRWSDGTESQALAWYDDEILICEGDLLGKTQDELRSLHFRGTATGCSPSRETGRTRRASVKNSSGRPHKPGC